MPGNSGDGGPATAASIAQENNICIDSSGNIYIADCEHGIVRKIDSAGYISTFAGNTSSYIYDGDGVSATAANIAPVLVTINYSIDAPGFMYISDNYNNRVLMVDNSGVIHNMAGNGVRGYSGDGGPATSAEIFSPSGIAFDKCGNLYISNVNGGSHIRKVNFDTSCSIVPPLATNKISLNNIISIYPNPAFDDLTISASNKITQVTISNSVGQMVYGLTPELRSFSSQNSKGEGGVTQEVDVAGWPPGIYVVRVTEGDGNIVVRKVVKE